MTLNEFILKNNSLSSYHSVVLFMKNEESTDGFATAWKVIQPFTSGGNYQFFLSNDFEVGFRDDLGNYTPRLKAVPGKQYVYTDTPQGAIIVEKGHEAYETLFKIKNESTKVNVDCLFYNDGKLVAQVKTIAPDTESSCHFNPELQIGIATELQEGDYFDTKDPVYKFTPIDIKNVRRADIFYREDIYSENPITGTFEDVVFEFQE